jgi:protein-disulfide isomerase
MGTKPGCFAKAWLAGVAALGMAVALAFTDAKAEGAPAASATSPEPGGGPPGGSVPLSLYLRRWRGIPPEVDVRVGGVRPGPAAGLETVTVTVSWAGQEQQVDVFRTTDGRYVLPGPLLDLTADPHAGVARRIDLFARPTLGPKEAPVTVVEYSSFQCPYCRKLASAVKEVMGGRLGKQVRWVYKHFPLETQPWSEPAAVAAECARVVGGSAKFWALHDFYFEGQGGITPENHRQQAIAWATGAGLPATPFERCLDGPDARGRVRADRDEGRALGVNSTPTLVINGRIVPGTRSAERLAMLLEQELAFQRALARVKQGATR